MAAYTHHYVQLSTKIVILSCLVACTLAARCDNPIFCDGPVLKTIQLSGILSDCKTFVDMPLRYAPDDVLANFSRLPNHDNVTLERFLADNFYGANADVVPVLPSDFKDAPRFLSKIRSGALQDFAYQVNGLWRTLVKKFDHSFSCADCFTSIMSEYPFVVPGGRFGEYYYWDSLWIVHGLLISEMYDTALHETLNILNNIDQFGYMPNGARIYYLSRTQPPVASQIVRVVYSTLTDSGDAAYAQKAQDLITRALPTLVAEYEFFDAHRTKTVMTTVNGTRASYNLSHYDSNQTVPRPESYAQDYDTHLKYAQREASDLYVSIGAAAETGWDFSTRWFEDKSDFGTIYAQKVFPVDLNSILYLAADAISDISATLGQEDVEARFNAVKGERRAAIEAVLYDDVSGVWYDAWREGAGNSTGTFYASNFAPLWAYGDEMPDEQVARALDALSRAVNTYPGGVPASEIDSGQQWDLPNAWPPSQYIILQGLWKAAAVRPEAENLARQVAYQYVTNAFCTWRTAEAQYGHGYMFEKYDSEQVGAPGGGGEYTVQTGFGWSNGVLLELLNRYGSSFATPHCPSNATRVE